MIEELKTDYKNDVLATSQQGKRTFNIVGKNGEILFEDVHIEDTSRYLQVGDEYGQSIINEQNTIINALMKGAYVRFETYAEYETAYENGEVAEGSLVIIDELTNDNITALQVGYNNSDVKATLDSILNTLSSKINKANISVATQIGIAKTPTTPNTRVTITLDENANHFALIYIVYGYGWGACKTLVYSPIASQSIIPCLVNTNGSITRFDITNQVVIVTTGTNDIGSSEVDVDRIRVFGLIRVNTEV